MAISVIPVHKLTPEALHGVIEEFVSRAGTDYGRTEVPMETKVYQVKSMLEEGRAVLVFDDESQTTNILLADDPVMKKLDGRSPFSLDPKQAQ
jgi:hypothetical protein